MTEIIDLCAHVQVVPTHRAPAPLIPGIISGAIILDGQQVMYWIVPFWSHKQVVILVGNVYYNVDNDLTVYIYVHVHM